MLNSFPQYRTSIDGLGIHFLHVRSPHTNALPLLITHGWPGSIVEFFGIIGPLTGPTAYGGRAEDIATMEQRLQDSMARQRFAMTMLGGFDAFAMILAAIGVHGVMSFLVTQGTVDIAIRMALGARRTSILSLVFQQGMGLTLVGIFAGLIGAFGLTRVMSSLLFGIKPTDPLTFFSVLGLLLLVALSACIFPGGRAMRIDPMAALRTE